MHYLFERIERAGTSGTGLSADALREAVRRQVQRVFASHLAAGADGLELMGFRLPSLPAATAGSPRYLAEMARLIAVHEPRLEAVCVESTPQAGMPKAGHVTIRARIAGADDVDTFSFDIRPQG